ncbi:EI24 domain-containing protein [Allopusillimonas soli]|uniref:EI24 domain-containing protein n=1 Tax=Allopusillimonas soli TaxID=659016 RepID=A0A853FDQ3_9BURK|nr:EI24 domain-containing protein [Allopusillimonas soli]NYT39014.1 EI24 domain-containing protein [Allopusillimonas soli]TEA69546.1 EI24 domain-containing protein [Allopusillimonas soli]
MSESDIVVRRPPRDATGMSAVMRAFKRAAITQCHPKMLAALFLPFFIALLGAIVLLWAFWAPLTGWLSAESADWDIINHVDAWMVAIGLFSIKLYLIPILAAGILLPLSGILGLIIAAVFVMPIVLRHLEKHDYPGLKRQGQYATAVSGWNAVWVGGLFGIGWLLTMPLWLIPPLAILLPVCWWAFAFTRMLSVDAIVEHASSRERRIVWRQHRGQLWTIGLIMALVNLMPPAWLVLPVFSALVYAHFSLDALRRLRADGTIDV